MRADGEGFEFCSSVQHPAFRLLNKPLSCSLNRYRHNAHQYFIACVQVLNITHTYTLRLFGIDAGIELKVLGMFMNIRALINPTCLCALETAACWYGIIKAALRCCRGREMQCTSHKNETLAFTVCEVNT